MYSLPDLPELESVSASTWGGRDYASASRSNALMLTVASLFVAASIYIGILESTSKLPPFGWLFIAAGIALTLWPIRIARADFYFETSERGLLARGWFRSRFVEWSQIKSMKDATSGFASECYMLSTDSGEIRTPKGDDLAILHLDVSIWQHLRRLGRDDWFELPAGAQTLWSTVRAGIPREMDWSNPEPSGVAGGYVLAAAICVVPFLYWLITRLSHEPIRSWRFAPAIVPTISLAAQTLQPKLRIARRVSVREDRLEIELPRRVISLDWDAVSDANWYDAEALILSGGPGEIARIPLRRHTDSETLILAIIRRLREREHPILIPLMDLAEGGSAGTDA